MHITKHFNHGFKIAHMPCFGEVVHDSIILGYLSYVNTSWDTRKKKQFSLILPKNLF